MLSQPQLVIDVIRKLQKSLREPGQQRKVPLCLAPRVPARLNLARSEWASADPDDIGGGQDESGRLRRTQ